jgi:serine/threonine protein kinase
MKKFILLFQKKKKTTRSILTEHRFLATTDHPFITKLYHSFRSEERLFMVMEYCPGGELFTLIRKQPNGRLNEDQVRFYASEVITVLEYVHSKGYIYRGELKKKFNFLSNQKILKNLDCEFSKI